MMTDYDSAISIFWRRVVYSKIEPRGRDRDLRCLIKKARGGNRREANIGAVGTPHLRATVWDETEQFFFNLTKNQRA